MAQTLNNALFVANAGPYLQTSLGSLRMQKLVLAEIKASAAAASLVTNNSAIITSTQLLGPLSRDQLMAAQINSWLSICNDLLSTGISTDPSALMARVKIAMALSEDAIDRLDTYVEAAAINSHLAL